MRAGSGSLSFSSSACFLGHSQARHRLRPIALESTPIAVTLRVAVALAHLEGLSAGVRSLVFQSGSLGGPT
jgi:hypothetical protein